MKSTNFLMVAGLVGSMVWAGLSAEEKKEAKKDDVNTMTYLVDLSDKSTAKHDPASGTFVAVDDPQAAPIAEFGSKTIEHIGYMLVTEINRTLATTDVKDSIQVMHLKDLKLPKSNPGQPVVTAIKRTSSLLRDPANAPDAADKAALDRIYEQLANNEAPDKIIVQKLEHPGAPVEWRVYRPIATTQACLACHGDPANFQPGVKEVLDRVYPGDKAIDYSRQEYRGVLRVSLAVPEPAKK
jgi:hypothetical protein